MKYIFQFIFIGLLYIIGHLYHLIWLFKIWKKPFPEYYEEIIENWNDDSGSYGDYM